MFRVQLLIDLESFVRLHWGSARGFPESSGGSELSVLRSMEDRDVREILFGVSLEGPIADFGTLALRASRASRREDLDSPGIDRVPPLDFLGEGDVPPSRVGDQYERWDLALVSTWNLPKFETPVAPFETRVILGADVAWEDGDSSTFLDVSVTGTYEPFPFFDNRRTVGIFCEIEQSIAEHATLSTSLRYDTTPDEDDRFSPAIGLAIEIPRTPVVLFGNYGEGFKRPSFYALGNPLIGDATLSIEKGRGWEVGLRGHALEGRLRGQISYFEIQVKNLIDFDAAAFSLVNQDRLVSRGSETEFGWKPFEWLDLRAGATFNYTNFAGSGGPDPENRPRWFGFGEIAVEPIDTIELNLRVLAVSSVKATSFRTDGRVDKLSGYARIDVRAAWAAFEWLDLFVEIENLTNQTYREAVGFESPGIAPRAGVTIRL